MILDLTEAETRELYSTTVHEADQLLNQIVHADHRAFKASLKDRHSRLDQIRAKLEAALPGVRQPSAA
jgi:hypothetical protein